MNKVMRDAPIRSNSPEDFADTLQSVHMDGHLDGLLLRMKIRQHYHNAGKNSLEAVYTFPMPWGAILLGLSAEIDGHRLQGVVMEKKKAAARYEQAIDEGDSPIMVERSALGLYTANLGNLKPGERAVIELDFCQLLRFEQGQIRITVPTVVGHRYGESNRLAAHESVDTDPLAEYPLTVQLNITGDAALGDVVCPSHAVRVSRHDDGKVVTLERGGFLDRDFVLLISGLAGHSFVSVAPDGEQFVALVSVCPALPDTTDEPIFLKVLVDCSGSMAGDSIKATKRALHDVMKELTERDWVSYSRFGSNVEHVFPALQPCSSATVKTLAALVDRTEADRGGTEMNRALLSTFELGVDRARIPHGALSERYDDMMDVLLITDGDIWGADAVIESAKKTRHRIFAIGVGSAPAESLLREVAEKSGGACELVSPQQNVAEVIVRMFHRMRSSRCRDIKVDWGQKAIMESAMPVQLYGGDTLHVWARFKTLPESDVTLRWTANGAAMQTTASQRQSRIAELLPRVVASKQIDQLAGSKNRQKKMVELALRHQLVTEHSNLILVHVREEGSKAEGLPDLKNIRHMPAAGWGGAGSVSHARDRMMLTAGEHFFDIGRGTNIGALEVIHFSRSQPTIKTPQAPDAIEILETFEACTKSGQLKYAWLGKLQSLNLASDVSHMMDEITATLGTPTKAWALVLSWLSEQLSDHVTLSRHSERMLRHALQGEDPALLQELKVSWAATIAAFVNANANAHEVTPEDHQAIAGPVKPEGLRHRIRRFLSL